MNTYLTIRRQTIILLFFAFIIPFGAIAQANWPISGVSKQTQITIFKPVVETFDNTNLSFRTAIALNEKNNPVFGSVWGNARVDNNTSTRISHFTNTVITDVRFPDGITIEEQKEIIALVQQTFNNNRPGISMDDILADLKNADKENQFASQINNTPPKIIFAKEASLLITIDGDPIIESTSTPGIDAIANTPFLILKYQNSFYLSNGQLWYKAPQATGNYTPEKNTPKVVKDLAKSLKTDEEAIAESKKDFYPKIIVSTEPAELIQTNGEPFLSPIQGTNLLYVTNTEEQILFDITGQKYYVLLSGRWFLTDKLTGTWYYTDPQKLPSDFAKIPEGSEKDVVLANVPGTTAANEALRDAQIPNAAAIDRSTASAQVAYDGDPIFESIDGTNLRYATNSSGTVLIEKNNYYLVDNGVWFISSSPNGPWVVSDYRPQYVNDIPPRYPVYNVKYVNIYYATPNVVYVGYTSGYLSNYVVGHTVVYGTGHYYRPWRGRYYYPRPCTWGYGMYYNPWYGWSVNVGYGVGGYGWFGFYSPWGHNHHYSHHYHAGYGWWGPTVYRPPYGAPYTHYYGHKPATGRPVNYGQGIQIRQTARKQQVNNNYIYNNRNGVSPSRYTPTEYTRPASRENSYNYSNQARPQELSRDRAPQYDNNRQRPTQNQTTRPSNPRENNRESSRPNVNNNNNNNSRPNYNESGRGGSTPQRGGSGTSSPRQQQDNKNNQGTPQRGGTQRNSSR